MARNPLRHSKEWYNADVVKNVQDIRPYKREVARLSNLANKRMERLEKAYPESAILRKYDRFETKTRGMSKSEVAFELSQLRNFFTSQTSSLTGIRSYRNERIDQLRDYGVTEENFDDFTKFMERWGSMGRNIASDQVVDVWAEAYRLKMSPRSVLSNMEYWVDHLEEMQELDPIRSKSDRLHYSSEYRKKISE